MINLSILNPYFYAYNPELLAFENAWVKFLKSNKIQTSVIKQEVADSWVRCKAQGMDPLAKDPPQLLAPQKLLTRVEQNKDVLDIVIPFMDTLYQTVRQSGFRVDFFDEDGYILKSLSEGETLEISKKTRSLPGACRMEHVAGTNSVDLSIRTKKPIQVVGSEHYTQIFHRWACSSAPILNHSGKVLGVLNISGRYELVNIHTLGMVTAAAKAIENELEIYKINQKLQENNSQLRTTLEIVTDGVIYIEQETIMQVNKEICTFLGKDQSEIIGRNIYEEIVTTPGLKTMITNENDVYKDGEIILKGKSRSYKCLFSFENVLNQRQKEIGKVMIFTRADEIQALASKIKYSANYTFKDIIGNSSKIKNAIDIAKKASEHDSRIIIEGESGTGKEMFAQAIHNNSYRKYAPFIAVDCGTLSNTLLESELFGYEKGAFTGANKDGKIGIFEIANKGTIFLDEIGNMSPEMQVKMLRVLQEEMFIRVGGTTPIATDVRVIAATNANLEESIAAGTFRQDLFYRLNVFYIKTPPLRERKEDIPLLVDYFIKKNNIKKRDVKLDKKVERILIDYDWPGNIRQLNNMVERALIMSVGDTIKLADLPYELYQRQSIGAIGNEEGSETLKDAMNKYIRFTLKKYNNNVSKAAKLLNVSRTTVYKAMIEDEHQVNTHE